MPQAAEEESTGAGELDEPACERQGEQEELLFTLELCRRVLPWDAHPAHWERLRRIEDLVRWGCRQR